MVGKFLVSLVFGCVLLSSASVSADIVDFTLDGVLLEEGAFLTGTFAWTYDAGDFENGTGEFLVLDVPYSSHDQTDLTATIDVTQSIEITLTGSTHDDGVDITLVLVDALTPTSPSLIDLGASKYEIGGNGFHTGVFLAGRVSPVITVPEPTSALVLFWGLSGLSLVRRRPV